jgi:hypothetical protein
MMASLSMNLVLRTIVDLQSSPSTTARCDAIRSIKGGDRKSRVDMDDQAWAICPSKLADPAKVGQWHSFKVYFNLRMVFGPKDKPPS